MVIQRWQSVFLLLTAALMAFFTFCSLGQVQLPDYSLNFTTLGFSYEGVATDGAPTGYFMHTWAFFVVSLLSFVLPFLAIFMYKNMRAQKMVCLIEGLLLFALIAIGCAYGYYNNEIGAPVSWSSLIIAWPLAFICDILAYNRISADQKLLRAADRLR